MLIVPAFVTFFCVNSLLFAPYFNKDEHWSKYSFLTAENTFKNTKVVPHLRHRHTEDLLVAAGGSVDAGDSLSVDVPQV